MPSEKKIKARMRELAVLLDYDCRDLSYMATAMYCKKEEGRNDYTNDAMATLGDAVMKLVWSEHFFNMGLDKDGITEHKAALERNATLRRICDRVGIHRYAYNDHYFADEAPANKRLPYGNHDIYLEALIAAVYLDRGLDYTREWILRFWKKNGEF